MSPQIARSHTRRAGSTIPLVAKCSARRRRRSLLEPRLITTIRSKQSSSLIGKPLLHRASSLTHAAARRQCTHDHESRPERSSRKLERCHAAPIANPHSHTTSIERIGCAQWPGLRAAFHALLVVRLSLAAACGQELRGAEHKAKRKRGVDTGSVGFGTLVNRRQHVGSECGWAAGGCNGGRRL